MNTNPENGHQIGDGFGPQRPWECFREELREDFQHIYAADRAPGWSRILSKSATSIPFKAAFLFRLSTLAYRKKWGFLAWWWHRRLLVSCAADIGVGARIAGGLRMPHPIGIVIGDRTCIGRRAYIMQGVTLGGSVGKRAPDGSSQPRVGDCVLIGAGARILGPVIVGDHSIIGANAVVVTDIPSHCVVGGIPARTIKRTSVAGTTEQLPRGDGRIDVQDLRQLEVRLNALESWLAEHLKSDRYRDPL